MRTASELYYRLHDYESATQELCEFLGRKDFRVMWNPKTSEYEVQQYIYGGYDKRPLYFWSTIMSCNRWGPDMIREVHWGLTVPGEVIVNRIETREAERDRDDQRKTSDAAYETAKWMWQATPHRRIYSTA